MPRLLDRPDRRRRAPAAAQEAAAGPLADAIARVVHDLVAPLTVIRGQCVALARAVPDPGVQVRAAAIDAEAVRLAEALDGIAGLVAPTPPRRPPCAPVDLPAFVSAVAERHRVAAEHAGVRLVVEPGSAGIGVLGARGDLRRALDNLLRNALRHAPPGGSVVVSVSAGSGRALVAVRDDGPGVHPDDRERIFRPGERGRRPRGAGRGLGLAIAREIAEAHGGWLDLDPDSTTGACFRLWLPLQPSAAAAEGTP